MSNLTTQLAYDYLRDASATSTTVQAANFASARLLAEPAAGTVLAVPGRVTVGDGFGGLFGWDATSVAADDNNNTLAITGVNTGRWVRISTSGTGSALTITQTVATTNARGLKKLEGGTGVETQTRDVINAAIDEFEHTPRPINARAAPYLATGNGTTDDTAALQAAIDAAIAQGRQLYIPKGIYKITNTLLFKNTTGLVVFGDGASKTRIVWYGTAAYPAKFRSTCSTTATSTTLTYPSGFLTADDIGKRIVVRNAGLLGDHLTAIINATPTATTATLSVAATATKTGNAFAQIAPLPALWTLGCYQCDWADFSIEGTGAIGSASCAEALRIGSLSQTESQIAGATLSQKNTFRRLLIGAVKVGIRIWSERDANNDFHRFEDCLVNNYDVHGMTIEDSQAFHQELDNCYIVSNMDYWTGVGGCTTTATSASISFPSGTLTEEHVGNVIEIVGAAVGGAVWRGKLDAVTSATTGTVNAASGLPAVSLAGTATIRRGAQSSVYCSNVWNGVAGSVSMYSGFVGTNLRADVIAGNLNGAEVKLSGTGCEGSRALVETEVASGASTMLYFDCIRFAGGYAIAEAPIVLLRAPGSAIFDNCDLSQTQGVAAALSFNLTGEPGRGSVSMRGCRVATSLSAENVFTNWSNTAGRVAAQAPKSVEASYIENPSGFTPIGIRSFAYQGGGAVTVSFGLTPFLTLYQNSASTVTMNHIPTGFGSRVRMRVIHQTLFGVPDGPFAITFSAPTVTWAEGRAPTIFNSRAGYYDVYEFWSEGAVTYGRVVGYAFGAPHARAHEGLGTPAAVVSGLRGDTFHRLDGGVGTSFYVCEADGTAGWAAK